MPNLSYVQKLVLEKKQRTPYCLSLVYHMQGIQNHLLGIDKEVADKQDFCGEKH